MSQPLPPDPHDPLRQAYRRWYRALRTGGLLLVAVVGLAALIGVPHFQTTYTLWSARQYVGAPTAAAKRDAWYLSVTGWRHVESGAYGQVGCPLILFIPLSDCVDHRAWRAKFWSWWEE